MKIALIGFGRMGHAIKKIALERKHSIITIDPLSPDADFKEISEASLKDIDVCIDFTTPTTAIENAKRVNALKKPLVIGTTGWYDKMNEMKAITKDIALLWSSNFSLGMNVFYKIIESSSKIFDNLTDFDVAVLEEHHNQKKDAPGGSAKTIGGIIIKNIKRKKKIVGEAFTERKPQEDELHVASLRCGKMPGTHTVFFDSQIETIELTHRARNLDGFALGAVMGAEFIKGKKGFFGIEDLMNHLIK